MVVNFYISLLVGSIFSLDPRCPYISIYMFPVPGSPAPSPNGMVPQEPPLPAATYYVRLPTTCYSLLPIYYLLPITTYYYLLPTTNYYLPHTTPPHRGRGDWTMLPLLGYHDHEWGVVGGGPRTWNICPYISMCFPYTSISKIGISDQSRT